MGINVGNLEWDAVIRDSEFQAQINRIEGRLNSFNTNVQTSGDKLEGYFKRAATAAAAFFSVQAGTDFVKSLVTTRGEFQQLEIAFSTMLKSKEKADSLMKDLIDFAATTPFGLKDTATAAKQLLAYGSASETVRDELRMLGDVSAGVSAQIGDIVYLYGTLRTQGRAYAVDIRQFAGRGIPIYEELARVLKVNVGEVNALVESGKVGFAEVEQAFKNMTAAGGMFGGLMEAQSASLTGQIEKLRDAWQVMLNDIGKSQEGLFASGIAGVADLVENYERIIDSLGVLIAVYGSYRAALILTAAHQALVSANTVGFALAINQESVAKIANANATANVLRAEMSSLAAKKASATQAAVNAAAALKEAQAKLANVSSEGAIAAAEKASLLRKKALAISSEFYAKKLQIETATKNGDATASLNSLRAEVSSLAAKKAAATQAAAAAAANVRATQTKIQQAATEKVIAAQETASIARKRAIAASSDFYSKRMQLETVTKQANSAATVQLTGVEALNGVGKRALTKITATYNAVLAASPIVAFTAMLSALGVVTYSLIQHIDAAAESQKTLNKVQEDGSLSAQKEIQRINDLVKIIQNHKKSNDERKRAYDELKGSTDKAIESFSQEQVAAGYASSALDAYTQSVRKANAESSAFAEYNGLLEQLAEVEVRGLKAVSMFDKLAQSIKNTFAPWTQDLSASDWWGQLFNGDISNQLITKQTKDKIQKQIDALRGDYGTSIDASISSGGKNKPEEIKKETVLNKKYWEEQKQKAQDELDSLSLIEVQGKQGQALLKKIAEYDKKIEAYSNKRSRKGETDALKVLKDISTAEFEAHKRTLSQNEQEIAAIKEKYRVLRAEAKKAGLGAGAMTRINNAESTELGYNTEEVEMKRFLENLDKKKEAYEAYEDLRLQTSKEKADEIYGHEIDSYKSFLELIQNEEDKLRTKAATTGLTGLENDALIKIIKLREEAEKQFKESNVKSLVEALKLVESYEQKKAAIHKKYADASEQLGAGITKSQSDQLKKGLDAELDVLNQALIEELDSYKFFFDNLADLSGNRLKSAASKLEEDLAKLVAKNPELQKLADLLLKKIAGAKTAKTAEDFRDMADSLSFMADALGDVDNGFTALLRTASNLAGQVSNIKGDIEGFSVAKANGNMFGQISSGLGIIGAGFNIMTTLNNFLDRTTAADEQRLQNAEMQLQATEGMTRALERQIKIANEAYGTQKIEEYEKAIIQATKTQEEATKALSGRYAFTEDAEMNKVIEKLNKGEKLKGWKLWGDSEKDLAKIIKQYPKLTTNIEELQHLLDNGKLDPQTAAIAQNFINATDAIKEAEQAMRAFNTAVAFDTLSDDLIDAISSGENAIESLGEKFETTMKDAILNSLRDGQFKKEMQKWYEDFDAAMEGGLTEQEAEKLRQGYMTIGERQLARLKELERASGIDLDNSEAATKEGSLSKGIAGITETTANRLEAEFGGLRLAQLQLLEITTTQTGIMQQYVDFAQQNVDAALKIERNTYRTAENTEQLKRMEAVERSLASIDSKITNTDALARGAGVR